MSQSTWFLTFALLGLLSGSTIAIQASTNAVLLTHLGKISWVAFALFVVGALYLGAILLISRATPPTLAQFLNPPVWAYLGGIIVASYVLTITFLVPRIGVANAIIFVVVGQIITATLIDHFGWFGVAVREINWQRGLGLSLLIAGIVLSRKG